MSGRRKKLVVLTRRPVQFSYRVLVTDGQATTPMFTFAAGAPAAHVNWGDGTARDAVTSTVELTHAYTVGGTYIVSLEMPNQEHWVTQIDLSSDHVVVPAEWSNLLKLKALTRMIDFLVVGYGEVGVARIAR